ncbi:hypothetical protein ACJQWK_09779 [Exserohilum turcicum]|uniref:Uncharacterized protein n=1 Tax=Exserohilum turcicum (strain 28A) TaxID=671987 RepID=R0JT66_EXST2|nr:uncharacterized protein SETTUDRAFT_24235 [Exserohilum turcica Et28A]EOA80719.1 hypothetical protein SETTUDRAFT_24235 [Exserohilum turcica Et28A]
MTSSPFQAALTQPEGHASFSPLRALVSAHHFTGPEFPAVAENYLNAFCNSSQPVVRRRWIGIALACMLEKRNVAEYVQQLQESLRGLGAIILSDEERGTTKIIAGLIMRQGLEQGIEYQKFWPSDKVTNSAPIFPRGADPAWVQNFHFFLNALGDLALKSPTSSTSTVYPASLAPSDELHCIEPCNGFLVAALDDAILTIIAPEIHPQNWHFVDIPLDRILNTRSKFQLEDSEPCILTMTLKTEPWSFCLDSTQQTTNEISLIFRHSQDALEWKKRIIQYQSERGASHIPHVSTVDARSSPSIQQCPQESLHHSAEHSASKVCPKTSSKPLAPRSPTKLPRIAPHASPRAEWMASSISKRKTYSKGKLPKVSQAAKQQALNQLIAHSDTIDTDAKHDGEEGTESDASSATSASQRRSLSSKKATNNTKTRKSRAKHTADDDGEYVPSQAKLKRKTNNKRKADLDSTEDSKQNKKPRVQPGYHESSTSTAPNRRDGCKSLGKPASSAVSSRHSLIDGLRASNKPTNTHDAAFKKPTLPAHITQAPSTPTKPRKKPVETPGRLQTPRDARRPFHDNDFSHMPSSPPIICEADEEGDWLQETAAEAAILSSNSKPVPASPNAESTAISGHADCEDVASEKRTGDSQTAKSDPFTRRPVGKKISSFIRRLTGDEPAHAASEPRPNVSPSMSETGGSGIHETEGVVEPDHRLSPNKTHNTPHTHPTGVDEQLPLNVVDVSPAQGSDLSEHAFVSPISKQDAKLQTIDTAFGHGIDSSALIHNRVIGYESVTQIVNDSHCRDDQQDSSEADLPPLFFHSSPPRVGSPSSHSSTSAGRGSSIQPILPLSQAEEAEWEANLEPYQRDLHDLLVRTSKRVMRHIVDKESGLDEIVETFQSDGEHVVESLLRRHENEYKCIFTDMESKKTALRAELELAMKQVAEERRRVNGLV